MILIKTRTGPLANDASGPVRGEAGGLLGSELLLGAPGQRGHDDDIVVDAVALDRF